MKKLRLKEIPYAKVPQLRMVKPWLNFYRNSYISLLCPLLHATSLTVRLIFQGQAEFHIWEAFPDCHSCINVFLVHLFQVTGQHLLKIYIAYWSQRWLNSLKARNRFFYSPQYIATHTNCHLTRHLDVFFAFVCVYLFCPPFVGISKIW